MTYSYPHTIDNGAGEQLTFVRKVKDRGTEYLEVENRVQSGSGPPMHTHFRQEESLTVVKGKIGVQVLGQDPVFYGEGDMVSFKAGTPHKFWNAGKEPLVCKGWIKPADNIEYFLTEIYKSTAANGGKHPSPFDAAYLMHKYRSEFSMEEIPLLVKKVIFPVILFLGRLQGKHKKFADGPAALV